MGLWAEECLPPRSRYAAVAQPLPSRCMRRAVAGSWGVYLAAGPRPARRRRPAPGDARVAAHWHRRRCLAAALARWSQSRSPAAVWRRSPYAAGWALATRGNDEARHARRAELAQCACELLLLRRRSPGHPRFHITIK